MATKKFLFYPLLLFILVFLLDKIFLLDTVKSYIKSDFTYLYYESKEELFNILIKDRKEKKSNKKLMVILGSSRLLYFDYDHLVDFYPEWDIYNFSSAVTTPAYYYYYIEKLFKAGIQPDLILLETDSNQFNLNSPVFKNSNLTYSFDISFILRYASVFGKEYVSFYLGKFLFASSKHKPYIDTAIKRLRDPNRAALAGMKELTKKMLLEKRGNAISLVEDYFERDFGVLEATSQRTIDWLYKNYKDSDMQFTFYEYILRDVKEKNVPMVIVLPQSSIPMQRMLKSSTFMKAWYAKTEKITSQYGFTIKDMDNTTDYYCNTFVDGGHISKDCYMPFMRYVMQEYYGK